MFIPGNLNECFWVYKQFLCINKLKTHLVKLFSLLQETFIFSSLLQLKNTFLDLLIVKMLWGDVFMKYNFLGNVIKYFFHQRETNIFNGHFYFYVFLSKSNHCAPPLSSRLLLMRPRYCCHKIIDPLSLRPRRYLWKSPKNNKF